VVQTFFTFGPWKGLHLLRSHPAFFRPLECGLGGTDHRGGQFLSPLAGKGTPPSHHIHTLSPLLPASPPPTSQNSSPSLGSTSGKVGFFPLFFLPIFLETTKPPNSGGFVPRSQGSPPPLLFIRVHRSETRKTLNCFPDFGVSQHWGRTSFSQCLFRFLTGVTVPPLVGRPKHLVFFGLDFCIRRSRPVTPIAPFMARAGHFFACPSMPGPLFEVFLAPLGTKTPNFIAFRFLTTPEPNPLVPCG